MNLSDHSTPPAGATAGALHSQVIASPQVIPAITDPAVIEAIFAADFEAEGAPGHEEVR